ncbi:Cof-type HAD-IIB family hydrolase [Micromonospora sp. RB23]
MSQLGREAAERPHGRVTGDPGAPPFRVVATDLDGTLLRRDLTISPRTQAALGRIRAAGALHVVVTGRSAMGCRRLLGGVTYDGVAVCGQGAELYDFASARVLASRLHDTEVLVSALRRLREVTGPLEFGVVSGRPDGQFLATPGFAAKPGRDWTVVTDERELWERPVAKVLLRHPDLDDDTLTALAERECAPQVAVTHSGTALVEVLPAGVSKASGLAAAAEHIGFTRAETIAFGDMPNDIPLLTWAGWGVAMGNAHPRLRTYADEITVDHEQDGVAVVLERLFL